MIPSLTRILIIAALTTVGLQVAVAAPQSAEPARLKLTESALEVLLTSFVFSQEGRWHLIEPGDCSYAILQNHSVELADGRISVRAKLFWSEAKRFLGECRGPSTTFEVLATATPVAAGATLGLRDIQLTAPDGDVVGTAALALLRSQIPSSYDVDVALMLSNALVGSEMTNQLVIVDFQAIDAQASEGTLEIGLGFTLTSRY